MLQCYLNHRPEIQTRFDLKLPFILMEHHNKEKSESSWNKIILLSIPLLCIHLMKGELLAWSPGKESIVLVAKSFLVSQWSGRWSKLLFCLFVFLNKGNKNGKLVNGRHIEIVIRTNDLNPITACLMSLGLINRAHHLLTSISFF